MKINHNIYLIASGKMGFDWTHPSDCNVYLVESEGELAMIDSGTGDSIEDIISHIESFGFSVEQLKKVFLTHIHADHAGGAALIKEKTGAEVYVHEKAGEILKAGNEDEIDLTKAKEAGFYPKDYVFRPCNPDHLIKEGDICTLGSMRFHVMETPGHSQFDLSFYLEDERLNLNYLFSGDTILYDGKISMINTHDFHLHQLESSINKLVNLHIDCLLPGHYHAALRNGSSHIEKAHQIFANMGVPESIN